jgi:hypothetical protein
MIVASYLPLGSGRQLSSLAGSGKSSGPVLTGGAAVGLSVGSGVSVADGVIVGGAYVDVSSGVP